MADQKQTVLGVGFSMPLLSIVAVVLRFYAGGLKKNGIFVDDYLIVIALVRPEWVDFLTVTERYVGFLNRSEYDLDRRYVNYTQLCWYD